MLQRHHMYRLPGRGKNFDPALFWRYSHSYLLYRCTLTILMSALLWDSVSLAMACNIYEVVHVACQSLSWFFYAATSNDFC